MKISKKYWYTELVWELARTDFLLRYHGSFLGFFWSLLKPLAIFLVMYFVFSVFMRWDIPHYQLFLLLGTLLWNFFSEATTVGLFALQAKAGIIKKVYFPRILIVLASTISSLLGLLCNMLIFTVAAFFSGIPIFFPLIILAPLYFLLLMSLIFGISLILNAIFLKFQDIQQIWEVFLQVAFWTTPIIYPISSIPQSYQWIIYINPMTLIIKNLRDILIYGNTPTLLEISSLSIFTVLCVIIGLFLFHKVSPYIAEKL